MQDELKIDLFLFDLECIYSGEYTFEGVKERSGPSDLEMRKLFLKTLPDLATVREAMKEYRAKERSEESRSDSELGSFAPLAPMLSRLRRHSLVPRRGTGIKAEKGGLRPPFLAKGMGEKRGKPRVKITWDRKRGLPLFQPLFRPVPKILRDGLRPLLRPPPFSLKEK
jgi:hypothetical protein